LDIFCLLYFNTASPAAASEIPVCRRMLVLNPGTVATLELAVSQSSKNSAKSSKLIICIFFFPAYFLFSFHLMAYFPPFFSPQCVCPPFPKFPPQIQRKCKISKTIAIFMRLKNYLSIYSFRGNTLVLPHPVVGKMTIFDL
jgi:hypothetical protein